MAGLVEEILAGTGAAPAVREQRLLAGWRDAVGERVAARAWPDGLRDGVLHVRVANSSWLHELSFLREVVVAKANALLGPPPMVREVRFHLGTRRQEGDEDVLAMLARRPVPRRPAARPRPSPPADVLRRIDEETARIEDEELREAIRAMRRRLGV